MEVRLYSYYELLINYTNKGKEMASEKLTHLGKTQGLPNGQAEICFFF